MIAGRSWRTNLRWTIAAPATGSGPAPRSAVRRARDRSRTGGERNPRADPARRAAAPTRLKLGVDCEQEGRRTVMRVGEAEAAADRAHRPYTRIRRRAPSPRARASRRGRRVALDRAQGLGGAHRNRPSRRSTPRSSSNAFRSITSAAGETDWKSRKSRCRRLTTASSLASRSSVASSTVAGRVALERRKAGQQRPSCLTLREHRASRRRRRRRPPPPRGRAARDPAPPRRPRIQ